MVAGGPCAARWNRNWLRFSKQTHPATAAPLPATTQAAPGTGHTPTTSYSYRVFAYNTGGDSNPPNTATTSTLAGTLQWERLLDGTWVGETDRGGDVAVDATGVYVCGTLESSGAGSVQGCWP